VFFLIRVLINAAGLWVATQLVPGISIGGRNYILTLLVVAVIFGLVNAIIKPILALLTCPLYILTLGLFTFVVNALMLLLTSAISDAIGLSFRVEGFVAALIGAIVIGIVSFVLSLFIHEDQFSRSRSYSR
jgi:putative membrane protein